MATSARLNRWLVAVVFVLVSAPGCGAGEERAPQSNQPLEPRRALEVDTWRVEPGSVLQRISAPGTLVARRESRIGAEVRGRLVQIFVEEADRVAKGAPLFQIEREPYEIALRQATARRDRARFERKQFEIDLERGRKLRTQDVLAAQRIDELATRLEVALATEREAAENQALARRNLDLTLVRAPYAASVAARLEDEGTTAQAQPQTIVVILQETSELEAEVTIPEIHVASIREGDAALLYVEGMDHPIAAWVSSVGDVIDPRTRTYLVKMRVPNDDQMLKAGVFARVELLPGGKSGVLRVPREAVRREDGRSYVLVVRDGRAERARVHLGVASEAFVEVIRGVREGDRVVVGADGRSLEAGMRVAPRGDDREAERAVSGPAHLPASGKAPRS